MGRLCDKVEKYLEPDKPQMTIWRVRIAWQIPKATNTYLEYVIFIAFPQQQCYVIRKLPVFFSYTLASPAVLFIK